MNIAFKRMMKLDRRQREGFLTTKQRWEQWRISLIVRCLLLLVLFVLPIAQAQGSKSAWIQNGKAVPVVSPSKPSAADHVKHYIRTHKRLLVADAIIFAAWGADAATSTRCQHLAGQFCVETNPLLPKHPSDGQLWGYAMGVAALEVTGEHGIWWAADRMGDPEAGHVLIWLIPVPLAIREYFNVQDNIAIANKYAPYLVPPCSASHCTPDSNSLAQARARFLK